MYTGTYVGNGVIGRRLTGWGFRPWYGFAKSTLTSYYLYWRGPAYGSQVQSSSYFSNLILRAHDDGLVLGDHVGVNENAANFWAFGFGLWENGLDGVQSKIGSYQGDGTDARDIAVGFEPDWVYLKGDFQGDGIWRSDQHVGDVCSYVHNGADPSGKITGFTGNGFTVDNDNDSNKSGAQFDYLAMRRSATGQTKAVFGDYFGSQRDSYEFFLQTPDGIYPDCIWGGSAMFSSRTMTMPLAKRVGLAGAPFTDAIIGFEHDGIYLGANDVAQASRSFKQYMIIETDTE